MEEDKLRFQQHLEASMADSMANHQAKMEQQLAIQLADMQAFMHATAASKDMELANAKAAINKANAENGDAAGQISAEAAAARSWQIKADEAKRALEDVQAQRARDAELAKQAQEDAVRQAASRIEARHNVDIQALEVKARIIVHERAFWLKPIVARITCSHVAVP